MENKTKTDLTPFLVEVQGKTYLTLPGLLQEAHANGLISLTTELLTDPKDLSNPVVKATAIFKSEDGTQKTYSSFGDACATNVAAKVKGALLRMSDSRAVARCLRFGIGLPFTALEELDVEESTTTKASYQASKTFKIAATPTKTTTTTGNSTAQHSVEVTSNAAESSIDASKQPVVKKFTFGKKPIITTTTTTKDAVVKVSAEPESKDVEFE